jgi:hypothetical protein
LDKNPPTDLVVKRMIVSVSMHTTKAIHILVRPNTTWLRGSSAMLLVPRRKRFLHVILFSILASLLFIGGVSTDTPSVIGQTRIGSLTLSKGENDVCSAVKDPHHDVAYFGTRTKPGIVVQVLLSYKSSYEYTLNEFRVYQTLTLNEGEDILTAAAFDPQWDIAYFGTYTGKVVQVVWGQGLHRGSSLDLQVQRVNCGVIDSDSTKDFAYFGAGGSTPYDARIVKVKIGPADWPLALVDTVNLNLNEGFPLSAVIDATKGFAYFGTSQGIVVKIRLSDFTRVDTISLNLGNDNELSSAVIDTVNGFAYFGTWEGKIVKIGLSDFTPAGTLTLQSGEKRLLSAIMDTNGFAYFGTETGIIVKVRLSDFTRVGALFLTNPSMIYAASAVIDADNGFAYFGADMSPGKIAKVSLSDFTYIDALTLSGSENNLRSAVIDSAEGSAYFGTETKPGIVARVRLSDFTRTGALTLNEGEDYITSAVFFTNNQFRTALFGTSTYPGRVVAVDLTNILTRQGACILNDNEGELQSAVIDSANHFAYFGTYSDPGIIVKVYASAAPSRWGALTLNPGEGRLTSAVIDTVNGFAYFGTNTDPGIIVKVRLSDFTRVGALTLNPGESYLMSAVIDAVNGFAYFGTRTQPGVIVKVRLSDFTRVGALTLNPGESYLRSAVIDTAKGFAYFGTTTDPGTIVKVRLSDFTRVGASAPTYGENRFSSAVIDSVNGFAYFGTSTQPGVVVKIGLDEPLTVMMTYKPYLVTSTKPTTVTTTYTTVTQFWVGTWQLKTAPIITTYTYTSFSPSYFRRMVTSTGMTTTTVTVLGVRGPFTVVTPFTTTYATAAVTMLPKPVTMTSTFMALTSMLSSVWKTFSGKGTATYVTYVVMEQTLTSTITVSYSTEAPPPSKGPCIIASAAYGSELAPDVQFLRTFRDKSVQATFAGTNFMNAFNRFYYSFSPAAALLVSESPILSQIVRALLYPLVAALRISSTVFDLLSFMPELAAVLAGILASTLIGAAYLAPPITILKLSTIRSKRKSNDYF